MISLRFSFLVSLISLAEEHESGVFRGSPDQSILYILDLLIILPL
jgi:hypothetical protein